MAPAPARLVKPADLFRKDLLDNLTRNGGDLAQSSEASRSDPDVVLTAIGSCPKAIMHACQELQSDLGFAKEAVHRNWKSLEFLPEELRFDLTVALAALRQNRAALGFLSTEVRNDPGKLLMAAQEMKNHVAKIDKTQAPFYEGESMRLVGFANDWRTTDSRLRFTRVLPGRQQQQDTGGQGNEDAPGASALGARPYSDTLPGITRHRLTVHLHTGFLSFQVLSCTRRFSCRIYPVAGDEDGYFVLRRSDASNVTAAWGGESDGHGCNFYIAEMAGTIVNIHVDLTAGNDESGNIPSLPGVAVWYEVECSQLMGELVSLAQAPGKQKPKKPRRESRLCSLVQDGLTSGDARVLVDPEAEKMYDGLVMEARNLSKASFHTRFRIRDLGGTRHLALLVDPGCSRTFGYCLYSLSTATGELQVEQLSVSDALRGHLLAWVSAQAESGGYVLIERLRESRSHGQVPFCEVRRRACLSDPDMPAYVVDAANGAELRETRDRDAAVFCTLPKGSPVFGEKRQGQLELFWPVPGWTVLGSLSEVPAQPRGSKPRMMKRRSLATAELFASMWRTRKDLCCPKPRGQCVVCSHALCTDVVSMGLDRQLGQGPCRVVEGSFHARPDGIGCWERHWFVMFGNGSIADVTADQFDEVPKLWWPADASRYAMWVGDQHVPFCRDEAGKLSKSVGWAVDALGWRPLRS